VTEKNDKTVEVKARIAAGNMSVRCTREFCVLEPCQ
jgi:hypothetical protein